MNTVVTGVVLVETRAEYVVRTREWTRLVPKALVERTDRVGDCVRLWVSNTLVRLWDNIQSTKCKVIPLFTQDQPVRSNELPLLSTG